MVNVLERYMESIGAKQRLGEHKEAVTPDNFLDLLSRIATFAPQRDTLGLLMEASGTAGEALAGLTSLAGSYLPASNPNTQETARRVQEAGILHPLRAQEAARTGPDSLWAWLAGAAGMAMDPSNLISGPVGVASEANTAAQTAKRLGARATLSDDFLKQGEVEGLARILAQVAEQKDVAQQADILGKLRQKPNLDDIFARADMVKQAPVPEDLGPLEALLANAGETYKGISAAKQAAETPIARQMLTTTGARGGKMPLKRGAISALRSNPTPEYLAAVDEAKTAAMPQGPGLPRRGQSPGAYKSELQGMLDRLRNEDREVENQLRALLHGTEQASITPQEADLLHGFTPQEMKQLPKLPGLPEDSGAVQRAIAAGVDPDLARQRSQGLGELNAQFNAAEQGQLPVQPGVPSQPYGPPTDVTSGVTTRQTIGDMVRNPVALDGTRPELERGYTGRIWDLIKYAVKEGITEQRSAFGRKWNNDVPLSKQVGGVWSGINIQTPRNIFMDAVYSRWVLRNEGIAQRAMTDNEKMIVSRLTTGVQDPAALFGSFGDILKQLGKDLVPQVKGKPKGQLPLGNGPFDSVSRYSAEELSQKFGANFFEMEADNLKNLQDMSALQQALIGAGLQLASPTRAVTGIATMPLNLLIPMRQKMFQIINNVTHSAARVAAFEHGFAPFIENSANDLLARATAEGRDVSALRGKVILSGNTPIAAEGGFSVSDVQKILGPRYSTEWERITDEALETGFAEARRVLGDYANQSPTEKTIKKFVPFMSWAWRAYPRAAKYALQHPALTAGVLHLYAADREQAKAEGRPGYQVGTLSIDGDTPFFGILASAFTPEQESEIRFNPLALFSPVGGDVLGAGMQEEGPENAYQFADQALGLVGGSFNPYIQAGAYVTGADWKAPGNASRYSPIDQYIGNETGLEAPTIQGPLRALRAGVTESLGDRQVDNYDPVAAKANELVLELTGKPIKDPSNLALALDLKNKGQLYQEAERLLLEGNARRSAFGAVSPQSVMVTTETKKAQRAAGEEPFSYEDIQTAQQANQPTVVRAMKAANEAFYANNPAAAVQQKPNIPAELDKDPRLAQWEAKNVVLKRVAPKSYAAARQAFIEEMGIQNR